VGRIASWFFCQLHRAQPPKKVVSLCHLSDQSRSAREILRAGFCESSGKSLDARGHICKVDNSQVLAVVAKVLVLFSYVVADFIFQVHFAVEDRPCQQKPVNVLEIEPIS